jgi:hypothetical protein
MRKEDTEKALTQEEREFWEDVRRTQAETAPIPGIDFKALVAESSKAFWSIRKAQIERDKALKKSVTLDQLKEMMPEELAWAYFHSNQSDLRKGFAHAALRFFDPIKEFFRDFATSTLPWVASLMLLIGAVLLKSRIASIAQAVPSLTQGMSYVLAILFLSVAVYITIRFFWKNSTGALVGGLCGAVVVTVLFGYAVQQRNIVKTTRAEVGPLQNEIQLTTTVSQVTPLSDSVLVDNKTGSLEKKIDEQLKTIFPTDRATLKKVQSSDDEVVYQLTQAALLYQSAMKLSFSKQKVDVTNDDGSGYRIMPLTLQDTRSDSASFSSDIADNQKIDLHFSEDEAVRLSALLRAYQGRQMVVTYDVSSSTLVGLRSTDNTKSDPIYYNGLYERVKQLSLKMAVSKSATTTMAAQ